MSNWRDVLNIEVATYLSEGGNQLKGFLDNSVRMTRSRFLFDGAQELSVVNDDLVASPEYSLALLVYAGLHPNSVKLGSSFESLLEGQAPDLLQVPSPVNFFQGNNLVLPKNKALDSHFRSFEHWTQVNEVNHISLWLLAALRSLFGKDLPSTLEVEIPLPGEARPGRLDVLARRGNQLICLEAKTSIGDAVKDRRFVEQVPKYKREILKTCEGLGLDDLAPTVVLATGGSESDLRSTDGLLRPTAVGHKFLTICVENEITFITANAIWQLLAAKLTAKDVRQDLASALEMLEKSPNLIGLTTAGFVNREHGLESWPIH
jgi:hypothetical protein